MNTESIFLIGAGGHCRVVYDSLSLSKETYFKITLLDSSADKAGEKLIGDIEIIPLEFELLTNNFFHVSVGQNIVRRRLYSESCKVGGIPFTVIHRSAEISKFSSICSGVFLAAQSVVAPNSQVGCGAIVNHGAVIDHDCKIGDFTHIAPNVVLGGGVLIGSNVLIGSGSVVLPGVRIVDNVIVGAGSVVTKDILSGGTYLGAPVSKFIKD